MLDPEEIHKIRILCQWQNDPTKTSIHIERIDPNKEDFIYDTEKLIDYKDMIESWFQEMASTFFKDSGGGWSFYNLSYDKYERLWTEDYDIIEEMISLGIAIGKCEYLLPRESWINNTPYIVINPLVNINDLE